MQDELESALLAAEGRCRALEASREHLWGALTTLLASQQQEVPPQLARAVADVARSQSSEAVRAEEAGLALLFDAPRASARSEVAGSPAPAARCRDAQPTRPDAQSGITNISPEVRVQPQLHAQLQTCEGARRLAKCHESYASMPATQLTAQPRPRGGAHAPGSFEAVNTIVGDIIAQLDRPSPFSSMIRAS